jgi:hypothetical protein
VAELHPIDGRERELLALGGLSTHLYRVFPKLGVASRTQLGAARAAFEDRAATSA